MYLAKPPPSLKEGTGQVEEQSNNENDEDDAIYEYLWRLVISMLNDPYPLFAQMTAKVIGKIRTEVLLLLLLSYTIGSKRVDTFDRKSAS